MTYPFFSSRFGFDLAAAKKTSRWPALRDCTPRQFSPRPPREADSVLAFGRRSHLACPSAMSYVPSGLKTALRASFLCPLCLENEKCDAIRPGGQLKQRLHLSKIPKRVVDKIIIVVETREHCSTIIVCVVLSSRERCDTDKTCSCCNGFLLGRRGSGLKREQQDVFFALGTVPDADNFSNSETAFLR